MVKRKYPNIVRGGVAIPLENKTNYYYMKGRKHSQGGIDIGKNPKTGIEVEDGEVLHVSDKDIKVFSSIPFLNGKSPAQKVMGGENPNKVFNQQESFKDKNNINDDGTKKKRIGGQTPNDKYTTKLTYKEEQDFRNWYSKVAKYKNLNPDPDANGQDYDYRGYWKNEDRDAILNSNSRVHFTDKYKTPNHPTFSNESIYSNNKTPGGTWVRGKGTWLFKHNNFTARQANRTKEYLTNTGEGYILNNDTIIPRRQKTNKKLLGGEEDNVSYEQAVINRDKIRKEINKGNIAIPYIKERNVKLTNAGKLTGAEFSENLLDSIAKYAGKANIPLETAVGLAAQESGLGTASTRGYIPQKKRGTIYASSLISNWSAGKDNPWNDLITTADRKSKGDKDKRDKLIRDGWRYTKNQAKKFDTNINTLQHGFEKFKTGTYNRRDPNHTKDVIEAGKAVTGSPEYQRWLKAIGNKIYNSNRKALGGKSNVDYIDKPFNDGRVYSVTVNGQTKLRMIPSTGDVASATSNNSMKRRDKFATGGNKKLKTTLTINNIPIKPLEENLTVPEVNPVDIKLKPIEQVPYIYDKERTSWFKRNKSNIVNDDFISDAIGLTGNIVGGAISHTINKKMLDDLKYNSEPVIRTPTKLKTRININPQLDKMRETLANYERNIDNNTASSRVALARKQYARSANMLQTNELYANKENAETELINKDRLNQQATAFENIKDYNTWAEKKAAFDNAVLEKKAENDVSLINTINTGVQDIISRTEKRKSERQTRLAMMAANPNVNPRILKAMGIKGITDKDIEAYDKAYGKKKKSKKYSDND